MKILKIIGGIVAVLAALVIVFIVYAYKSGLVDQGIQKAEAFKSKAMRTEAKIILSSAKINLKIDWTETGVYADTVDVAFPKDSFTCEGKPTCYNYVYAIQSSCERGGAWQIPAELKPVLNTETAQRLPEIEDKMKSLSIPCKAKDAGFNILAIGIVAPPQLDALLVNETEDDTKILIDSVGF